MPSAPTHPSTSIHPQISPYPPASPVPPPPPAAAPEAPPLTPATLAALLQTGLYSSPANAHGLQLLPVTPQPPTVPARPVSRWRTYLWRTLVITLAGSGAFLVGSFLAERTLGESLFYIPGPDQPPVIATFLKQSGRLRRIGQRLPIVMATTLNQWTSPTPTPPALSDSQRQQLEADLNQLQVELDNLTLRTAVLEAQLDGQHPSLPLEQRLQRLAQAQTPPTRQGWAARWQALTNPERFTITLPSDALFTPGESTLRSESLPILANISADLRRHRGATVQVAVHTDDLGTTAQNRELSLQQAKTIADYLGTVLGDQYRWVLIGYGESAPLTPNQTDSDRQRNRRLEIAIAE